MSRPPLEVADLIRAAGEAFIERNRHWMRWLPGNAGLPRVSESFFPHAARTWSSHSLAGWRHWSCRTRNSSTISCSVPVRKLFWKLPATRYAWVLILRTAKPQRAE
jgi:hypothetical protein